MKDYINVYIKTADDPSFWIVLGGERFLMESMTVVYETGLLPVVTISQEEMDAIPIGDKEPESQESEGLPSIQTFKNCYKDEALWVIGSGPSIEYLRKTHIKGGPVLAINWAIQQVESLGLKNDIFSMQKDRCFVKPDSATLLVHEIESRWCFADYKPQYVFNNPDDFELDWYRPSDMTCVAIAKLFGCKKITYLCCDASANKTIGSIRNMELTEPKNATDLLAHRALIDGLAEKLNIAVRFITPKEKK